jgi:hypothetical protein
MNDYRFPNILYQFLETKTKKKSNKPPVGKHMIALLKTEQKTRIEFFFSPFQTARLKVLKNYLLKIFF